MVSSQPNILKGGLVLLNPDTGSVERTLPLLINPSKLTRKFEIKTMGEETGRSAPLRLTGPASETITLEAKLEVSDAFERGDEAAQEEGVRPQMAVLQSLVSPSAQTLVDNDTLQQSGALEIVPMKQPLMLFVWGPSQIVPARILSLSMVEEFFSPKLFPLSATVSMTLRVLSVDDLGVSSKGGALYLTYLRNIEKSAERVPDGQAARMGIEGTL
ncbi:MAG: hypothetical protein ABJ370_04840 [Paracoccaceae bacterium]